MDTREDDDDDEDDDNDARGQEQCSDNHRVELLGRGRARIRRNPLRDSGLKLNCDRIIVSSFDFGIDEVEDTTNAPGMPSKTMSVASRVKRAT